MSLGSGMLKRLKGIPNSLILSTLLFLLQASSVCQKGSEIPSVEVAIFWKMTSLRAENQMPSSLHISSLEGDTPEREDMQLPTCQNMTIPNYVQVIEPVRSRCLCIRVAAPSQEEVGRMIRHVALEEGIEVPEELVSRLSKASFFSQIPLSCCFALSCKVAPQATDNSFVM